MEQTETNFGTRPVGTREVVIARVGNAGHISRRILGLTEGGRAGVCFSRIGDGPVTVPPGEFVEIRCSVELREPGPVQFQSALFLENDRFEEVTVKVRGHVLASKEAGHDADTANRP